MSSRDEDDSWHEAYQYSLEEEFDLSLIINWWLSAENAFDASNKNVFLEEKVDYV